MVRSGYALVGRTIKPQYYRTQTAAFNALRRYSERQIREDGNMGIWVMKEGKWFFFYAPNGYSWQ